MPQASELEKLDAAIAALEGKLTAFRALREVLANSDAADEVRSFFLGNGAPPPPRKSEIMEKIEVYFHARQNEWATIDEIVSGTRIKKESLRQAIYKGHSPRFQRDVQPGGGRAGKYRLKK